MARKVYGNATDFTDKPTLAGTERICINDGGTVKSCEIDAIGDYVEGNTNTFTANQTISAELNINSSAVFSTWTETGQAVDNGGKRRWVMDNGDLRVDRNTAAGGDFSTFDTEFGVSETGNFGIGTYTPSHKLDVRGDLCFAPGSSVTANNNGDVVIEATNNTTLTFKLKGSDGTVRSGTLTLS